jgi:cob(II)yrinic acid a,c-diamide reductase
MAINALDYREAMSRYAGHVQIITTRFGDTIRGTTITAACSVTDQPPMLLACINNQNQNNQPFFESDCFVLNTLGAQHEALAGAFAGFGKLSNEERFALGIWEQGATGAPILSDAIAAYECKVVDRKETESHTVLFGEIVGLKMGDKTPSLLYLNRGFHTAE